MPVHVFLMMISAGDSLAGGFKLRPRLKPLLCPTLLNELYQMQLLQHIIVKMQLELLFIAYLRHVSQELDCTSFSLAP